MDVVYIVKETKDKNMELFFSLRSLQYIKYNRVFIIGYKPKWIKNIIHIDHQDLKSKYENVKEKHKIIADLGLDDFIYMNDDFYFLEEQEVKNYIIGTLQAQKKYIQRRDGYKTSKYYFGLQYIEKVFGKDALSYEAHTPMIMNGQKLKDLINKYPDYKANILRSLYGNYYKIKAEMLENTPNYKGYIEKCIDCKCYYAKDFVIYKGQKLLSSENTFIKSFEFRKFLYNKYNTKSKFESLNFNFIDMNKKEIVFNVNLFPYKKGDIGQIPNYIADRLVAKGDATFIDMIQNKSMQDKKEVIKKEVIKKDYSNYTKKELQKELESLNINYNKKDNKNTLLELLK